MKNKLDRQLIKIAKEELFILPQDCIDQTEELLQTLSGKKEKTSPLPRIRWKTAIALAAALSLLTSITAFAAVNYVKQRMESMNREKIREYFDNINSSVANADSYSRPLLDSERERLEQLAELYETEGKFPEGELTILEDEADYKNKGVAYLPLFSRFYFPEEEMSDEHLLEYIDFMAKRDYSLSQINPNAETAEPVDDSAWEAASEKIRQELSSNKENQVIEYSGEMKAERAEANRSAVYFSERAALFNGGQSYLYKMKHGENKPVRLNLTPPEGMQFSALATDEKDRMCVLLIEKDFEYGVSSRYLLWKLGEEDEIAEELDLTEAFKAQKRFPIFFAADQEGRFYFDAGDTHGVVITDSNGKLLHLVKGEKVDVRGLGRGKDGSVYASVFKGDDPPAILRIDGDRGSYAESYDNILPDGVGAFLGIRAGVDYDFLLDGDGVYAYNLGDEKAVQKIKPQELPLLRTSQIAFWGGRAFVMEGDYLDWDEEKMDFHDLVLNCFYWIAAETE